MNNGINKSKLMKRAWEIAEIGFYDAAFRSITGKRPYEIEALLNKDNDHKKHYFNKDSLRRKMRINFTKKDFFAVALKMAWAEAKKSHKITETNKNAPRRKLVPADKHVVGEKLHGFIITGIGRSFRPNVDMFSMGITPDTEYVEYAYFN